MSVTVLLQLKSNPKHCLSLKKKKIMSIESSAKQNEEHREPAGRAEVTQSHQDLRGDLCVYGNTQANL